MRACVCACVYVCVVFNGQGWMCIEGTYVEDPSAWSAKGVRQPYTGRGKGSTCIFRT